MLVLFLTYFQFSCTVFSTHLIKNYHKKNENIRLISVFQSVCWYTIYLNQLHNVIIIWHHWTVFAFNYVVFPKIAFVVMMWTVFLRLSRAIRDLLLWAGCWIIALSKTKGNVLTEISGSEFLKNIYFMQLVFFHPLSPVSNSHVL